MVFLAPGRPEQVLYTCVVLLDRRPLLSQPYFTVVVAHYWQMNEGGDWVRRVAGYLTNFSLAPCIIPTSALLRFSLGANRNSSDSLHPFCQLELLPAFSPRRQLTTTETSRHHKHT